MPAPEACGQWCMKLAICPVLSTWLASCEAPFWPAFIFVRFGILHCVYFHCLMTLDCLKSWTEKRLRWWAKAIGRWGRGLVCGIAEYRCHSRCHTKCIPTTQDLLCFDQLSQYYLNISHSGPSRQSLLGFTLLHWRNGNNGPGDSAGRSSFLCPVCLRKVWLALSFAPADGRSVLSRYQVVGQEKIVGDGRSSGKC